MRVREPPVGLVAVVSLALPPCSQGGLVPQGDRSPPAVGRWPGAEHGGEPRHHRHEWRQPGRPPALDDVQDELDDILAPLGGPGAANDGRVAIDAELPGSFDGLPRPEVGDVQGRGQLEAGAVTAVASPEGRDPARSRIELDVAGCLGIDGGHRAVVSLVADDHRGVGGVLDQPAPVQPADGQPAGRDRTAADADVEGAAGPAHQVAAPMTNNDSAAGSSMTDTTGASNVARCRGRRFRSSMRTWTGRSVTSVRRTSRSTPSGPSSNRAGSIGRSRYSPSSPPTWAISGSRVRPGCR